MKTNIANVDELQHRLEETGQLPLCGRCAQSRLKQQHVKTAVWREAELMVVENIPALVCPACGEEFIGPKTEAGLQRMCNREGTVGLVSHLTVPVIDFAVLNPECV
ncbi:YgiT-type zinc finger protein [Leisingera thetidis]|uniref:YgiT-type zinc finger protein n=1 Tax=Leisingera thetidis TaxID=2930199 RepID=UPI0021F7A3FA|nr:YgiT-type zinc finger protein [Leisingera thetidis]